MNATTTTRKATNDQGQKFNLPASWPTREEIKDMQFGLSVFADLLKFCQNTIIAGTSISEKDRFQLWENIEESFLQVHGSTWQEMLSELRDMLASAPEEETAKQYPACLDPISEEEISILEEIHTKSKFVFVPHARYCEAFKVACSHRRHGLRWQLWFDRALDLPIGTRALIAYRAYSMDSAEVVKVGA